MTVMGLDNAGEYPGDGELVARARHGDAAAYDALFRRHYAKVYNFALRMEPGRDNAADIAQIAFVRAYESLPNLRDGQSFLKWIYRIVINLVRDRAKQERRKPWTAFREIWSAFQDCPQETEPVEFADTSLDPARITLSEERNRALEVALSRLPLEFREVIVLHHLNEMDLRQITEILGVPEGTVKSRLGRGRQRLRVMLRAWVEVEEAESDGLS